MELIELIFIKPENIDLSPYVAKTTENGWVRKAITSEYALLKREYPDVKIKMKTLCVYFKDNIPIYIHRLNSNSSHIEHLIEVESYMLDDYNIYTLNLIRFKDSISKRKKRNKRYRYNNYNLYNLMQKKMLSF